MGYGIKPPGYWNGKKFLSWRYASGGPHGFLQRALDIWQEKAGVTFTEAGATAGAVDFEVVNGGSTCQWSPSQNKLWLKGPESLGVVLHEIGHLLGMSHEHERPDARQAWYEANPGAFGTEESIRQAGIRGANLQTYGANDVDSIMQYPQSKYANATAPSSGDIAAVKQINGWT